MRKLSQRQALRLMLNQALKNKLGLYLLKALLKGHIIVNTRESLLLRKSLL